MSTAVLTAVESATRGPNGITVPGMSIPDSGYHSGGFLRFAPIALGTNDDYVLTIPKFIYDYRTAVWYFKGTSVALGGGVSLDCYLQTTYDGIDWWDVRNIHWTNGDADLPTPVAVATIFTEPIDTSTTVKYSSLLIEGEAATTNFFDGALANDTEQDLPLGIGTRVRVKTIGAATGTLNVTGMVK